ncbi:redoxin domain-containing protein [Arcicella lustrica]|uniref:Redoxin domain-containing protein n=1 Tax=Arcicella lustrica TaxID=2984196 RepID=A0ABU5SQL1_9BACT|nr:redoxin domain-containing protein [Arcicella sp. DC25W]MEA5429603.1 redoxin domain-containing protein [Arcicella sp. DC25W]
MKRILILSLLTICVGIFGFKNIEEHPTLEIGSPAPNFNLKATDGKMYSLNSFAKAKVLVVVFTCNHCPTAQAYEERIKKLVTEYKTKGVQIIAISPNDPVSVRLDEMGYTDLGDSFNDMKIRAKEHQFNFPYLYDGDTEEASKKFGPVATPHVFIFDQKRILRYSGRIDDVEKPAGTPKNHDTKNAIEALLADKPVAISKTKTFGCSVKWGGKRELAAQEKIDWAKEPVSLETIDEGGIKNLLKNNSGKLRLINVWATWCGPCVAELPDFMTINRMYRLRDFELVTISADKPDKKDKALATLKRLQASTKNYIFNSDDAYKLIELIDPKWQGALPYTLLVEPNGKIVYQKQGTINPQEMKRIIVDNPSVGRVY